MMQAGSDRGLVQLHPDSLKAVGREIARLLRQDAPQQPINAFSATAEDVGRHLGVKPSFVRSNWRVLGGVRLGEGERPIYRFNLWAIHERLVSEALGRPESDAAAQSRRSW